MTKQQRLWQKRRKNTAIKKRFQLVRNHANPWERRGALPRLPGASIPSPCQKESPTILSQPACWCSQTRSSLCFNGKRRKSSKNGNSQNTEPMLIFFVKICFRKNPPLLKTKQRSPCHSFPVISAWKSYRKQRVGHEYSQSITATNLINCLLKGHWGENRQVGDLSVISIFEGSLLQVVIFTHTQSLETA